MDSFTWAHKQLKAATAAGKQLVLQPASNLNSWTGGVNAYVGMRVQTNPAFVEEYSKHGDIGRWGVSDGQGTVVSTCDSNSELVVQWDTGFVGSCVRAGKGMDFWLITV